MSAFGGKADMSLCSAYVCLTKSGHGAGDAAIASVCRLYGPQSNLLRELGNLDWHAVLTLCHEHRGAPNHCESNMTVVREPRLEPVAILDLRPTQMTVGMREVKAKRERWRAEKKS